MSILILSEILTHYNHSPYYVDNDFISIRDDRIGRIVSFKLYLKNNELYVDFIEAHKSYPYITSNYLTKEIYSLDDFNNKWHSYYNFNY